MTVFEYAIIREAQKIAQFPGYRPKGWERLIESAWDIEKRDARRNRKTESAQAKDVADPVVSRDRLGA